VFLSPTRPSAPSTSSSTSTSRQNFNDVSVVIVAALEIVRGSLEANHPTNNLFLLRNAGCKLAHSPSTAQCFCFNLRFHTSLTMAAQSKTQNVAELCSLLIGELYGELPSVCCLEPWR